MDIFLVPMKKGYMDGQWELLSCTVPVMVARYGNMYTKRNIASCGHRNHSYQR